MQRNNDLIRFIRSSGIFFLGNILSKVISFFMLPIYTGYIAVADMGYYDVSITYTNMVVSIVFFEIWSAVLRYMYDRDTVDGKYRSAKSGGVIFAVSAAIYVAGFVTVGLVAKIKRYSKSSAPLPHKKYLDEMLYFEDKQDIRCLHLGSGYPPATSVIALKLSFTVLGNPKKFVFTEKSRYDPFAFSVITSQKSSI